MESSVRFAVKLPGLAHANVSIHHQPNGDATLAIEAIPVSAVKSISPTAATQSQSQSQRSTNPMIDTKQPAAPPALNRTASMDQRDAAALQNFLFDFKLTSSTPLQIDSKDIAVSYGMNRRDPIRSDPSPQRFLPTALCVICDL